MDWINLAQDRDKWWAVVITVMKFQVIKIQGISWLAEELSVSWEGLCYIWLVGYLVSLVL